LFRYITFGSICGFYLGVLHPVARILSTLLALIICGICFAVHEFYFWYCVTSYFVLEMSVKPQPFWHLLTFHVYISAKQLILLLLLLLLLLFTDVFSGSHKYLQTYVATG
jgi:hypothetical protein